MLTDPFLTSLALKMLVSAVIVIIAAFIVERSGSFLGAMVVSLPIAAGPAYVYLAMDHPPEFIAASAESSLISNAAVAVYMAVYAVLAQSRGLIVSLGSAILVWAALVLSSRLVSWTLPQILVLNFVFYWVSYEIMRRLPPAPASGAARGRWWETPMRAVLVMLGAAAVIVAARWFGPEVAGVTALIPIGFSSMAAVLHLGAGGRISSSVFAHALPGMVGMLLALLTVRLAAIPLGSWRGLGLALAVSVAWNAALIGMKVWKQRA